MHTAFMTLQLLVLLALLDPASSSSKPLLANEINWWAGKSRGVTPAHSLAGTRAGLAACKCCARTQPCCSKC